MAISFSVLASGSRGNATLLLLGGGGSRRVVLIDCGLSPRAMAKRLSMFGLALEDVSDVLLTHLDRDHFHVGWSRKLRQLAVRVHLHLRHRNRAVQAGLDGRRMVIFDGPFELASSTAITPVLFAHDDLGTVGYIIEHEGHRFGHATDLGRVQDNLLVHFTGLHALALESNYDRAMQIASARPWLLKRRIMGGAGHLSNEQSLEAVLEIDRCSALSQVALLHLSEQCNHPRLLKGLYAERAPHLLDRLTITHQRRPTAMLEVKARAVPEPPARIARHGEQLSMF
jgi:phosphoribosyl 1,2-cyclic phosphodiesterase